MTALVSWDQTAEDEGGHVHFEAFQCSKQCVQVGVWVVTALAWACSSGPEDLRSSTGAGGLRKCLLSRISRP